MVLFPPWVLTNKIPEYPQIERSAGYHFLFRDNSPSDNHARSQLFAMPTEAAFVSVRIDSSRLAIQIVGAFVLIAICYLAVRSRPVHVQQ
jgi:hypothetical protein